MDVAAQKRLNRTITVISVAVPVAVAVLLAIPTKYELGEWTRILPHVIGSVNTITCATLLLGLYFIKRSREDAHRAMMVTSLILGAVFLICYVLYHLTSESKRFDGAGALRAFYIAVLVSHVVLSLVVLPLVLRAAGFAFAGQFELHKRVVRFAYPIWLYVSITGVVVYALAHHLSP